MFYEQADRSYAIAEELGGGAGADPKGSAYRIAGRTIARWCTRRAVIPAAVATALQRVVARAPAFSPAWWRLGEAEFKLGRRDAAVAAWERARTLPEPAPAEPWAGAPARRAAAPISAYAALGLARAALAGGDAERARQVLEEVTAAAPAFGPGMRLLGTAYAALGRAEDAERAARRADRMPGYDPYVDPTFVLLARESRSPTFLLQQAAAADAGTNGAWREYLIRRALELDPDNTDALEELATLLRVLRRFDEALDVLRRLEQRVPDDPRLVGDIGRCLSGLRRYGEAEASCAARSPAWTMPITVTTSGSCSIAPAGWPRRWTSTAVRSPTIQPTGTRSTTSALPLPGPAAWRGGGAVRAAGRRRPRQSRCAHQSRRDAAVDGAARSSRAGVSGRARDRPRPHRRARCAGENQFSEEVRRIRAAKRLRFVDSRPTAVIAWRPPYLLGVPVIRRSHTLMEVTA